MKIGYGLITIPNVKIDDSFEQNIKELAKTSDKRRFSIKLKSQKHLISIQVIVELENGEDTPKLVGYKLNLVD